MVRLVRQKMVEIVFGPERPRAMLTAPDLQRLKVIGKVILTHQITCHVKNGVAVAVSR